MGTWTNNELERIGRAEELEIAGLKADGSFRKWVIIWVVRAGDDLYVRSYKGRGAGWFKGALENHAGRVRAGGVEKEVAFVEVDDPSANDEVDAAYRAKYGRSPYFGSMVSAEVRGTTLRLDPRG